MAKKIRGKQGERMKEATREKVLELQQLVQSILNPPRPVPAWNVAAKEVYRNYQQSSGRNHFVHPHKY